MRYCADESALSGVARFGEDCEGPPGCVHGGAIATVAGLTIKYLVYCG